MDRDRKVVEADVPSSSLPEIPNKPGKSNWVEKAGGLPSLIKRVAKHLQAQGRPTGVAIATAVNWAKKMCASGTAFGGKVKVSPKAQAAACKAVASWEAKKVKAKVTEGAVDIDLEAAMEALIDEGDVLDEVLHVVLEAIDEAEEAPLSAEDEETFMAYANESFWQERYDEAHEQRVLLEKKLPPAGYGNVAGPRNPSPFAPKPTPKPGQGNVAGPPTPKKKKKKKDPFKHPDWVDGKMREASAGERIVRARTREQHYRRKLEEAKGLLSKFEDRLHPRNRKGEFRDVLDAKVGVSGVVSKLMNAEAGTMLKLSNGASIRAGSKNGFADDYVVDLPGGGVHATNSTSEAATAALKGKDAAEKLHFNEHSGSAAPGKTNTDLPNAPSRLKQETSKAQYREIVDGLRPGDDHTFRNGASISRRMGERGSMGRTRPGKYMVKTADGGKFFVDSPDEAASLVYSGKAGSTKKAK